MAETISMIDPRALKVHPRNAEFFDDIDGAEFDRLVESIKDHGVLTPLRVTKDMTIISGHQRVRAAIQAECFSVPVIIDETDDENDALMKLIETNFGRMNNDPIKQAKWLEEYMKLRGVQVGSGRPKKNGNNFRISQDDIAKELGIDVRSIANLRSLLKLDPALQSLISEGKINATTGFKILSRLSPEEQLKLIEKLPKDEILSSNAVKAHIEEMRDEFASSNATIKQENDRLRGEKEKLRAENNELRAGALPINAEMQEEIDRLGLESRDFYEKWTRSKDEISRLRAEIDKANQARAKAETIAKGGEAGNLELQNQLDELQKKLEAAQRRANDFEFQLEEREEEIKALKQEQKDKPFRTALTYPKDDPRTKEKDSDALRMDLASKVSSFLSAARGFNASFNTSDLYDYFPLNQFEPLIQITSDAHKECFLLASNLMEVAKKLGAAAKATSDKQSA